MANKWIVLVAVMFTVASFGAEAEKAAKSAKKQVKKVKVAPVVVVPATPKAEVAPVQMTAPAAVPTASTQSVAPTAETAPETAQVVSASEATVTVPAQTKLLGSVEVRPSWTSRIGEVHTENELTLGYQFNPNTTLQYYQYVNTNLYNPGPLSDSLNVAVQDGFVRFKQNNILSDDSNGFHYEGRLYAPTSQGSRDRGMTTAFRSYFKFSHKFSNAFTLTAMETPIIPVFNTAGVGNAANPAFENRVYLVGTISFTDKLVLDLPIWLSNTRNRNYQASAPRNNDWAHSLWIYPELTYFVNPNLALGIAYYNNDSFLNADFGGFNIGNAFETGVTQLIVRASL